MARDNGTRFLSATKFTRFSLKRVSSKSDSFPRYVHFAIYVQTHRLFCPKLYENEEDDFETEF